jgi:ferrochelatase
LILADKTDKEIIGVILLNLGGPDSIQAVRPFLYNLFSDRQILKLGPSFLQKPIAWLISSLRSKKTESMYSLIGSRSPILDITSAQAKTLEEALNQKSEVSPPRFAERGRGSQKSTPPLPPLSKGGINGGVIPTSYHSKLVTQNSPPPIPPPRGGRAREGVPEKKFKVYVGMRYWHPLIEDVIPVMYRGGIRKIVALSLYPQYSVTTSGSSLSKLKEVVGGYPIETLCISSWFDHPLYIEALVDVIKKGLKSFSQKSNPALFPGNPPTPPLEKGGTGGFEKKGNSNIPDSEPNIHVLFSAHSLPHKIVEKGDPYVHHINGTIREITKIIPIKWHLSFQSKSGLVKWLEPSTDEKLKELAAEGIKNILVVPISFVSDHIETLYEIDILYKNVAEKLGITLKRVDSLNTHHGFIGALKDLVRKSVEEAVFLGKTGYPAILGEKGQLMDRGFPRVG